MQNDLFLLYFMLMYVVIKIGNMLQSTVPTEKRPFELKSALYLSKRSPMCRV